MKLSCYLTGRQQAKDAGNVFSLLARGPKCCASLDSEKYVSRTGWTCASFLLLFFVTEKSFSFSFSVFIFLSFFKISKQFGY